MKIIKRFFAVLVALTFMLGLFSTNYNVHADTQKDGYNITISNVAVSPNPVNVGALASLKFDFSVYTLAQNAMKVGDTVTLSTNIGSMFGNLPITDLPLLAPNGEQIATATITETEIKLTVISEFPTDKNFFSGSVYTGGRLKALENGAAVGAPVTKQLTIEDSNTNVTFNVPNPATSTGTGGGTPDPSARTINNRMLEKQGWTSGYDTAHIKLISNQISSLRLFNTYNTIDSSFGTYTEQTNLMVVDKIPHDGVIDESTVTFTAVRYNWMEVPAAGNAHYAQATPGTVMPIESRSHWIPVTQYFTQIYQSGSDTYDSFYAKVKAQKLSYGIFRDPATGGDTFIANMSNDSLKYTDLEPNLAGIAKIKDIYGVNGPSNGNVVTFFAEFDTHYPTITGLESVTNTGEVKSDQGTDTASVSYTIDKANGTASVAAGTVIVKLVDGNDDTTLIPNAEFKIQRKINNTWVDYFIRGRKASATTNASGIATFSGLSIGDYRLVQVSSQGNYTFNNKEFKPNTAYGTAGTLGATTGEFSITSSTQPGFATIVPNYLSVSKKITGSKEYVDQDENEISIPENTFKTVLAQLPGENYDGVTMPTTLTADIQVSPQGKGFFEFEEIKFTKPGTFKFSVKEDVTNPLEGVTYDTSEKTVTITVTKANGELKAEVDSEPSFKNVFNYTYANFKVKKTLTGDTPTTAGEFKFELTAVSTTANVTEVPMPAGSNADKKEVSINGAGDVEFGQIKYEAVGKYVYKVVEVNTNLANYTYDQAEYTVTVDVTTDADNKLVSTYEIKKGTEVVTDIVFTNKYETPVAPVTPATPASPKTGDSTTNMMFMFGMLAVSVALMLVAAGYKKQLR